MNDKKMSDTPSARRSSLRRYASKVFRESSVGMVSSLAETPSKPRKCFKVFVLIFCLTGFLSQSAKFLTVVFQYPTSVNIDIIRPNEFIVPAYSFCDNNGIKRSLFCEKYPERCEEPDEAFCEKYEDYCGDNKTPVPKREFYNATREMSLEDISALNANLSDFLRNTFDDHQMITGPYMRVDLEDEYNILMCYSLDDRVNSTEDPLQKEKEILFRTTIGEFRFYVDESEMFMPGVRPGILFSIHSPFVAVNPIENGIFMKPGRSYVIYVSMEEEILLKSPYETDCINYTEFWERNGRVGPRNQEMCKHRCFQDISMACFNCVAPFFLFPTKEKICTLASNEMDETKCPDTIFEDVIKCEVNCKDDCKRTKYSYNVQERFSMKFDNEGHVLEDIDRLIFVKVYLEDDEVIVLQHSPKYMIVEVFSTIGGFIGGWLGISLLDVTDIFEGFFRIIRYAFK